MPSNTGNIIQHYYTETASAVPSANNLYKGELALNITDGKLFYKDNSGTVKTLADTNLSTQVATSTFVIRGGNAGAEGGQLVLGYGNGAANTITWQAANTWNVDVDQSNNFRIFRQDSTGNASVLLFANPATNNIMLTSGTPVGSPDVSLDVRSGVYSGNMESSLQVAVPTGQWKSRFGIKSNGSGIPRAFLETPSDSSGNRKEFISSLASGFVGINKVDPSEQLHVVTSTSGGILLEAANLDPRVLILNTTSGISRFPQFAVINYGGPSGNGGFGVIELQKARGTQAAPLSVQADDVLGGFNTWGSNGTSFQSATRINGIATSTFSSSVTADLSFLTTTAGTQAERVRIKGAGQTIFGGRSISVAGINAIESQVQIDGGAGVGLAINRFTADANQPTFQFLKSRNATYGSHTLVQNGDGLGSFVFAASDGTNFEQSSSITAQIDGTAANNSVPGRLIFATTPSGSTTPVERIRITNDGRVSVGLSGPFTGTTFSTSKDITGGTTALGIYQYGTVKSDVTSSAYAFRNNLITDAASFTLADYYHFFANQTTIGANSFVTSQYGFAVGSSLTGANNNYGFYGGISEGPNRWNFYATGTANNYFSGNVWIGTASAAEKLYVRQSDSSSPTAVFENSSSGGGLRGISVRATNNNIPGISLTRWYSGFTSGDVGQIRFDGLGTTSSYVEHAAIYASTTGSNTANGAPTVLSFRTYPGTGSPGAIERMRISAAGFVGIGTTNPVYNLDIAGTLNTTGAATFGTTTRGDAQVEIGNGRVYISSGATWAASASATVTVTYNAHGFVNGNKVDLVFANTAGTNATSGNYTVAGATANTFTITNPTSITGNGTVIIGSAGNAYLDLIGDTTYTDYGARLIRYAGGANTATELLSRGTSGLLFTSQDAAPMVFKTTNIERGRFAPTGAFLVGRTYIGNEKIGIGGSTSTTGESGIYNDTTVGSATTTAYTSFNSYISTAAATFTLGALTHYKASQFTIGANSAVTNQYGFFADATMVGATNDYGFYSDIASGTGRWNFYANGTANNYFGGSVVINTNNAFDGLRITQTGAGNALVVEDSANPDSTPFVIDTNGTVISGHTTSVPMYGFSNQLQILSTLNSYQLNAAYRNDSFAPFITLAHSRNATVGSHTIVSSGDSTGGYAFAGSDGSSFVRTAQIESFVDGSPSANDMPGRLVFSTTADAANTPTERMRIDNAGNVNIGTFSSSISSKLTVVGQANFTDTSSNTRLRIAYGTIPGLGGTGSYIVNADNSPLHLGANNTATGGLMVSTNNNVIIGSSNDTGAYKLQVVGAFAATTKSFLIDHPTKPGMKLRYASLEGPENGVYIRGRCKTGYINLPDYWAGLVDSDTITVDLTPVGKHQKLYVGAIQSDAVFIGNESDGPIDCFYTIYAERKDVEKLIVEFDGE
jgi:hypothetical protein